MDRARVHRGAGHAHDGSRTRADARRHGPPRSGRRSGTDSTSAPRCPDGEARFVHALGALDMALWDICGKAAGKPTWQLLGQAERPTSRSRRTHPSCRTGATSGTTSRKRSSTRPIWAHGLGFKAAKLETLVTGPYAHSGLDRSGHRASSRSSQLSAERSGPDFAIMVDVAYAWSSVAHALAILETWAEYDVFFVETPLWADDLEGYAELARRSPIKIAAGEWLATRYEFLDLMDRGEVRRRAARRRARRRVDRGEASLRPGRRAEEARRPARLEDGNHDRRDCSSRRGDAATCRSSSSYPQEVAESALRRELVQDELSLVDGQARAPRQAGSRHRAKSRGARALRRRSAHAIPVRLTGSERG